MYLLCKEPNLDHQHVLEYCQHPLSRECARVGGLNPACTALGPSNSDDKLDVHLVHRRHVYADLAIFQVSFRAETVAPEVFKA